MTRHIPSLPMVLLLAVAGCGGSSSAREPTSTGGESPRPVRVEAPHDETTDATSIPHPPPPPPGEAPLSTEAADAPPVEAPAPS